MTTTEASLSELEGMGGSASQALMITKDDFCDSLVLLVLGFVLCAGTLRSVTRPGTGHST